MACLLMTVAVAAVSLLAVQGTFQTDILGDLNRARQGEHVTKPLVRCNDFQSESIFKVRSKLTNKQDKDRF